MSKALPLVTRLGDRIAIVQGLRTLSPSRLPLITVYLRSILARLR